MYAIIIERVDENPRVVAFGSTQEALDWRAEYEKASKGTWDGDPGWHNYPSMPVPIISKADAMGFLRKEVDSVEVHTTAGHYVTVRWPEEFISEVKSDGSVSMAEHVVHEDLCAVPDVFCSTCERELAWDDKFMEWVS